MMGIDKNGKCLYAILDYIYIYVCVQFRLSHCLQLYQYINISRIFIMQCRTWNRYCLVYFIFLLFSFRNIMCWLFGNIHADVIFHLFLFKFFETWGPIANRNLFISIEIYVFSKTLFTLYSVQYTIVASCKFPLTISNFYKFTEIL